MFPGLILDTERFKESPSMEEMASRNAAALGFGVFLSHKKESSNVGTFLSCD